MVVPNSAEDVRTISEVIHELEAVGYVGHFRGDPGRRIHCFACDQSFVAAYGALEGLVRLEGVSAANDTPTLMGVECAQCGERGTALIYYGPGRPVEDSEILRALGDQSLGSGTV